MRIESRKQLHQLELLVKKFSYWADQNDSTLPLDLKIDSDWDNVIVKSCGTDYYTSIDTNGNEIILSWP